MTAHEGAAALDEAIAELAKAADARKCWHCGCLHGALDAIERAFPAGGTPPALASAVRTARERLEPIQYECLGCDVCYPALALGAVEEGDGAITTAGACPTESVTERDGWPPLPGAYTVLRYHAPVAVCTLTDADLGGALARTGDPSIALVGTLQTENLGIERLILNVLANLNLRFLVVGGSDSRQAVGHLPGQSLVALARAGLDEQSRIVGAKGKRPVLRNIRPAAVEHFRASVEVVDLVGTTDPSLILAAVRECASRTPGPARPFAPERTIMPERGAVPDRMVRDPAGYFVVYVDRIRRRLLLEHYQNDGLLDAVIEGSSAAELYMPAVGKGLLSRLDHAAYLGRELARAEQALLSGGPYLQDAAPERWPASSTPTSGCTPHCDPSAHSR